MIVPAGAVRGLLDTGDGEVGAVAGDHGTYLVLDHRIDALRESPARVEFWRCTRSGETPVAGLFVLVESIEAASEIRAGTWDEAERLILASVAV